MVQPYETWRLSTDGGIRYALVTGPKLHFEDLDKASADERYLLRAQDVQPFYQESLPSPYVFQDTIVLPTRRKLPGVEGGFYTQAIEFSPINDDRPGDPFDYDDSAPANTYEPYYWADIHYEVLPVPDTTDPDSFLDQSFSGSLEVLTINPKKTTIETGAQAGGGGVAANQKSNADGLMPIQKYQPIGQLQLRWKYVLDPDWAYIFSLLGAVNSLARPLFLNSEPDTVMFSSVSGSRQYLWYGSTVLVQPWSLDFTFSFKRVAEGGNVYGWNHVWSPDEQQWVLLLRANNLVLHPRLDLLTLFA